MTSRSCRYLRPLVIVTLSLFGLNSCNVFSPIDQPGSDLQYLSAARGCFDKGDLDCAMKYYSMLSSGYADYKVAEEGFVTLEKQGASMAALMEFVGNLSDFGTGQAFTIFANRLTGASGVSARVAIWNVYNGAGSISNPDMQNFVKFISSLALSIEILSEASLNRSQLLPSDLANSSSACTTGGACNASCAPPATNNLATGGGYTLSTSPTNTTPTSRQLFDAIKFTSDALTALHPGGRFTNLSNTFTAIFGAAGSNDALIDVAATDQCFRQELLTLNVGKTQ